MDPTKKALLQYVHHVHYVVHDRDAMVDYLAKNFAMKPDRLVEYKNGNRDALYKVGETHMQITEPTNAANLAAKHLAKHGPGIFHVAWGVENIQQVAKELARKGNIMREDEGLTASSRGYVTSNIDPSSACGVWFQLAEGEHVR